MEQQQNIFADGAQPRGQKRVPLRETLGMVWKNLKNRRGRYLLVFVSIGVVVAFLVSTVAYQTFLSGLRLEDDVHTQAVLQRAGALSHDAEAAQRHRARTVWVLCLSGALCFVGVLNTMYMSVTERYREIGTLKCLGALNGFIVGLFMIESVFIGLVGSGLGALAGYLLALVQVGATLEFRLLYGAHMARAFAASVPPAVVAGTVLTVAAAVYPSVVAARMKPADAMRVEV